MMETLEITRIRMNMDQNGLEHMNKLLLKWLVNLSKRSYKELKRTDKAKKNENNME